MTIEALPAGYGDAVLVTCALAHGGVWRLLVDTGPDECWPMLKEHLARVPADSEGKRHIDLAVISHIDHDHIGAARALFEDRSLGLSFGDIWFNAPPRPTTRGVAEGHALASLLGTAQADWPWNKAWGGKPAVVSAEQPFVALPGAPGEPRITLLSPTPETLNKLFEVWEKELRKFGKPKRPKPKKAVPRGAGTLDLEALAAKPTKTDRAPANGSSIAMLLEHQGASVLLAADAYAPVLTAALRALATHRNAALPWQFDVFKLSHHASRANITTDLFRTAQAQHYIVSTNGAMFDHPDEEAIARTIISGGAARKLWFNYLNEETAKWGATELRQRYGHAVSLPPAGAGVVSIAI